MTGEGYDVANASVAPTLALGGVRVNSTPTWRDQRGPHPAAYQDDLGVVATRRHDRS
ncbi:hypothetical protein EMGBS10_17060 [Opitutia bacterium]|nr:hypothetical protein EMGBS10_17060 [Opitutae bacterium]